MNDRRAKPFVIARDGGRETAALRHAVVAIGNFDGVHRGHRAVIDAAVSKARALGRPAAVLTFEPHPVRFFRPEVPAFRLTDETAKLRLFAATGLDGAVVLTFNAALANLTADEFIARVLMERLAVAGTVVGFNFHFGKNRAGSPDYLAAAGDRLGFEVEIVPPLTDAGLRISSGAIRDGLAQGRVSDAAHLLGFPWFVSGRVIRGDRRGRTLGYPTANLQLDPACGLRHGIYAVRVGIGDRRLDGVASFGRRPTFGDGAPLLEVFLFDFDGDLYDAEIDVAFMAWIRPELRFESAEELIRHMDEDSAVARATLAKAGDRYPPIGALVPPI